MKKLEYIQPEGFPPPKGYANGILARGQLLFVAGQIGWDEQERIVSTDFAAQFAKALDNVIAVVRAAGGEPSDIVRMTVYVTDVEAYRNARREVGKAWRERMGKHYPTMALLGIAALFEEGAMVEIEATAVIDEKSSLAAGS